MLSPKGFLIGDKIDELKLKPVNDRVDKLEDNQKWLQRTVGATIIGILIKILFDVAQYIPMIGK